MSGLKRVLCFRSSNFRSDDSGQALVEVSIAVPLLFVLLLAAVEFARFAYAAIEVSNAANAAVDYAAGSHTAAADWSVSGSTYSGGVVTAATTDAANLSSITVTSIANSCVCANTSYTPTSCSDNSTCSSNNTSMIEAITVKTQTTYDPGFYLPGMAQTITLYGQATRTVSNQ
ncbi:MAG TPA: TadE/TadG family type IV pilus assembly protein [Terracidiphilus sp.]|nr:TadE/TadG family type IV pilus assembly protein [Terracidiphilus sp.]